MKLLILTQKIDINDDVLGFFHGWIAELAKRCEKITIICLYKGEHNLPNNVRVLSLGKEKLVIGHWSLVIFKKLKYIFNFFVYIWQERKNYDVVFVHMNPEYVLLGGCFWKLWKKKICLWYAHKSVNLKLRIAEKIVDIIFTPTKESFRLASKKLQITGHGIDTEKFLPADKLVNAIFKIITVGRISPVKDYETLISAAEILKKENFSFEIEIAGGPATKNDKKYFKQLKDSVTSGGLSGLIKFTGSVPNKDILSYYQSADLFINLSQTGSLDKAILEAMAAGVPVISCNDAAEDLLKEYSSELIFKKKDPVDLAGKILSFNKLAADRKNEIAKSLRNIVERDHNLKNLINKILDLLK